jgi:hypothetical protein
MPGRNEGQLVRAIAQGRSGQPFNKGLTVVALPDLCSNEQMAGSPESVFEWRMPHDLDRFHVQARPGRGMAPDDARRRNVDKRARFEIRMQPCRRSIFGDRMCGRRHKTSGLIQGRFGGAGHCSISLAANDACFSPRRALRSRRRAIATTIKTRSLPLSR